MAIPSGIATAKVWVGNQKDEWALLIGIVPELPVPLLLGKDWPAFPSDLPFNKIKEREAPDDPRGPNATQYPYAQPT